MKSDKRVMTVGALREQLKNLSDDVEVSVCSWQEGYQIEYDKIQIDQMDDKSDLVTVWVNVACPAIDRLIELEERLDSVFYAVKGYSPGAA